MAESGAPMASSDILLARERPGDPCVLVIFGAAGDLTQRLLIPSLYNLAHHHLLPNDFAVVGFARNDMTDEDFRRHMRQAIDESARVGTVEPAIWENLEKRLCYIPASFDDAAGYTRLAETLEQCDRDFNTQGNYLFYLATPPTFFGEITQQ